jgi:hypothetical protein
MNLDDQGVGPRYTTGEAPAGNGAAAGPAHRSTAVNVPTADGPSAHRWAGDASVDSSPDDPSVDEVSTGPAPGRPSWWVLAPAVMCFAVAACLAMRLPVFFGGDERSHFTYTVSVINGELPSLDKPQLLDDRFPIVEASYRGAAGRVAEPRPVGVANHPPAAYVIAAPLVRLAAEGPDSWPPVAMRLMNAAAMSTGIVLTGCFAAAAFPRARLIGLASATLAAVTPSVAIVAAWGQNDGLAFASAAGALYVTVKLLQRRPSIALLGASSLVAALAFLTRASLAPLVAMLVGAAALSEWRHRSTTRAGLVRAVGAGGFVGVVGLAGGVWFLLRNDRLYGSPTADTYLLERYSRIPHGSLADVLTSGEFPWLMFRGLYAAPHHLQLYDEARWVVIALVALCVAGAVAWLARRGTSQRAGGLQANTASERGPLGVTGWLLVAAACAGTYVGTASFYAEGGAPHPRYFFALVPVTSALLARAACELPGARAWLVATVGLLGAVSVSQITQLPDIIWLTRAPPAWTTAPGPAEARAAMLVVAVVAAAVAVTGLVVANRKDPSDAH